MPGSIRLLALCACFVAAPVPAQHKAHVHGVARLDVAVQGPTLSIQIEAPLDNLVGFEHRPRTAAQRQAAAAALRTMNDAAALFRPDAAAGCTLSRIEIDGQALEPLRPGLEENEHADLDARYEFQCTAPDRLATLDVALFERFARMNRIDVQVAGVQGQSRQTLRRPAREVKLRR